MKWNLFVTLVDKFDFVICFFQDEEYVEEEVFSVIRNWLDVELTYSFGLLYHDEKQEAFNVLFDFLKERYREKIYLNCLYSKIKKLQEKVALLDNGDTIHS